MPRCANNQIPIPQSTVVEGIDAECSFCGSPYPKAYQHVLEPRDHEPGIRTGALVVCEECAVTHLPAIIADALAERMQREATARHVCKQVCSRIEETYHQHRKARGISDFL